MRNQRAMLSIASVVLVLVAPVLAQTTSEGTHKPDYWTDPKTKLMWTAADNSAGLSQEQAVYYCRALRLGGFKDWRLPDIDQLQHLFGGPVDGSGHHIVGPITLTGWVWSATPGKDTGEAWTLDFGDGGRASVVTGDSGLNRALCVRRSRK